jgi:hypothetical protein
MPIIDKELANKIVKKLKARLDTRPGRPHDLALVFEGETLIASFGLRRGSQKSQGHDHIPSDLHLSARQTKDLAHCPMSREQWLQVLREKNLI